MTPRRIQNKYYSKIVNKLQVGARYYLDTYFTVLLGVLKQVKIEVFSTYGKNYLPVGSTSKTLYAVSAKTFYQSSPG